MTIVKWANLLTEEDEKALFKAVAMVTRAGWGEVVVKVDKGKVRFFVTTSEIVAE